MAKRVHDEAGHDEAGTVVRNGQRVAMRASGTASRRGHRVRAGGRDRNGAVLPVVAVLAVFGLAGATVLAGMPAGGAAALVVAAATAATQLLQQVLRGRRDASGTGFDADIDAASSGGLVAAEQHFDRVVRDCGSEVGGLPLCREGDPDLRDRGPLVRELDLELTGPDMGRPIGKLPHAGCALQHS